MMKQFLLLLPLIGILACTNKQPASSAQAHPNVILVLTDDQGIGDIGCHGNPWINTPNLDAFYERSVHFTDFHVSPLCTPTRGALMTGRYPIHNGTWATYKGRDALQEGTYTLAQLFKDNGYATGLFGKWHLGDNYPVRPTDCGFDVAIHHKAGGVGELSDYWGNTYFDDVYYVNNVPQQFQGYCTDIWFAEAMKFMDAHRDEPFFAYIPTNAPHDPLYVAESYAAPYRSEEGKHIFSAAFYGMITNIDENVGKLTSFLTRKGLADNTILIFMTDNGSGNGVSRDGTIGYNFGLSGKKGSKLEGGHRVPFFIHWKNGKITGGKDLPHLAAHIDLIPTLAGLCGFQLPDQYPLDGVDLSPLLAGEKQDLEKRTIFVHHRQDWRPPKDLGGSCILQDNWRLVNGKDLYDVKLDRKQENNVSNANSGIVQRLLAENKAFVAEAKQNPVFQELPCHVIGNPTQPEITLTIQHAIGEDKGIWKSAQVAAGMKNRNNTHAISVEQSGTYLISCQRWPKECPGPLWGVPELNPKDQFTYHIIRPQKVRISIANQILEQQVIGEEEAATFTVNLQAGKTLLVNDFVEGDETYGVYYTYIQYVGT